MCVCLCVCFLLCIKVTQDCISSSQPRASQASEEEESNNTPSGWEFLHVCVCVFAVFMSVMHIRGCVCVCVCVAVFQLAYTEM